MVRQGEEGLLLNVEEYCLEELLPHLHVHPGRQELENVTQTQLEQLTNFTEQWTQQAAPVLNSVGEHAKTLEAQVAALQPVLRDFSAGLLNQPTPETPPPEILRISSHYIQCDSQLQVQIQIRSYQKELC